MVSLRRFQLLLPCLLAAVLHGQAPAPAPRPEAVTTIVLVRHAEKASDSDPDSPLSDAGHARARALADQLAAFRPAALVVSQRRRTQETLAPLAERLKLTPLVRNNEQSAELAAELLKHFRGRTVVLAWHHGPHEPFARALGVKGELPVWTSKTYDRIWIIRVTEKGGVAFEERVQAPVPSPSLP